MNELFDRLVLLLEVFGIKTGIYTKLEIEDILIVKTSWTDEIFIYSGETLVCHFVESTNKKIIDGQWQEKIYHKSLEAKQKWQTQQKKES